MMLEPALCYKCRSDTEIEVISTPALQELCFQCPINQTAKIWKARTLTKKKNTFNFIVAPIVPALHCEPGFIVWM